MSEEIAQANADRAEIVRLRAELEQVQSDYAMLRGAVRLIFGEQATDQHMLDLWNLVTTVEHPGAAMNIRFNKLKAELEQAQTQRELWERQVRDAHNALERAEIPVEIPHEPHEGCPTQLGHRVRAALAKLSEIRRSAAIAGANSGALHIALDLAAPHVCSSLCPTVWKTSEGPRPHSETCQTITALLEGGTTL